MSLYSNDVINIQPIAAAATPKYIGAVTDVSHVLNTQLITPQIGDPYDPVQSIQAQSPEIPFQSNAIASWIDAIGFGLCIDSDIDDPGVEVFAQKHDPCGIAGRASGSNHLKITVPTGYAVIETINADANGNVVLSGRIHATSTDGVAAPVSVVYNSALPASPASDAEHFALGAVSLTTVGLIDKLLSVNIAYNVQLDKPQYAGSIWPKVLDVRKIQTLITIRTNDSQLLQAAKIPLLGLPIVHATSTIDLYKRAASGGFLSLGSAFHIRGTINGLAHITQHNQASGDGVGVTEIQIAHAYDGTNAPIVWDTTAAVD